MTNSAMSWAFSEEYKDYLFKNNYLLKVIFVVCADF